MLIYSLLHLAGYEKIGVEEIKRFRVLGSHCARGIPSTTRPAASR
jgi:transketolase